MMAPEFAPVAEWSKREPGQPPANPYRYHPDDVLARLVADPSLVPAGFYDWAVRESYWRRIDHYYETGAPEG
jgi:hypothetical protein